MKKRKELIYEEMKSRPGEWTTTDLAERLGLQRTNVSKELNELVREGRVNKIKSRPVRYALSLRAEEKVESPIKETNPKKTSESSSHYIFQRIIGSNGSMKTQIEQAKAAILYPPRGLNCLLTGQTGTGKTLFAHTMFQFAKKHHLIAEDKELTVFNCADYANNSELLMSHLFGYTKGAFTGAEETTDGLIQQADGGMLFLDEIHRLPPEGQEMIFYFMDHGCYSRLGEVEKNNYANVRIVCATTDDPTSSLLSTFTRRIPIMIQLPSFHDRPANEQVGLLKTMLQLEASRVDRTFQVEESVAKALIGSVEYGNVGQLKSNVQFLCARGFLNHMEEEVIPLTAEILTPEMKSGLNHLMAKRKQYLDISCELDSILVIHPHEERIPLLEKEEDELPYNLYEIIDNKASMLKSEGMDQEAINNFITTDINLYLKRAYQKTANTRRDYKLSDIVANRFIDLAQRLQQYIVNEEYYPLNDDFLYAMSLHLSAFVKRTQEGAEEKGISNHLVAMVENYPKELYIAQKIKDYLETNEGFQIPKSELYYLATLLISLKTAKTEGKISIIVAAHGNSTASSMVQVVTELLNVDHLYSFDMNLEMEPSQALQGLTELVQKVNRGKGVLLLIDMGSLATFTNKLQERTGVEVATVEMVTTAMVLEAARKTMMDIDLQSVYEELCSFKGYSRVLSLKKETTHPLPSVKPKMIVSICATGEGAAVKIQNKINDILVDQLIDDIVVQPISVVNMDETIEQLQEDYHIVAAVGIKAPKGNIPFLTLPDLLQGKGERFLQLLDQITQETTVIDEKLLSEVESSEELTKEYIEQCLREQYFYINPEKILPILWEYLSFLDRRLPFSVHNTFKINLIMHLAGMIERIIQQKPLSVSQKELSEMKEHDLYRILCQGNDFIEKNLMITIPEEELYYLIQLFDTEREKIDTK